jgi:hypothetical protein
MDRRLPLGRTVLDCSATTFSEYGSAAMHINKPVLVCGQTPPMEEARVRPAGGPTSVSWQAQVEPGFKAQVRPGLRVLVDPSMEAELDLGLRAQLDPACERGSRPNVWRSPRPPSETRRPARRWGVGRHVAAPLVPSH